jgi:dTDP-4-dehydrorhamnose 3,5-epimerase
VAPITIAGVLTQELQQIADDRGKVMHLLRVDSPLFSRFGEIYFSVVNPGVVKAWKRHREMTQNLSVPVGKIRLAIFDDRPGSPSCGRVEELEIGEDNYLLVKIPPLLWYGFQGLSAMPALIANCADLPHRPEEVEYREVQDHRMPYTWN